MLKITNLIQLLEMTRFKQIVGRYRSLECTTLGNMEGRRARNSKNCF